MFLIFVINCINGIPKTTTFGLVYIAFDVFNVITLIFNLIFILKVVFFLLFVILFKRYNFLDYLLFFTVSDTHHMLSFSFKGNYTIKVVGGGPGVYQQNNSNFRLYTQNEIESFNYIPGKR